MSAKIQQLSELDALLSDEKSVNKGVALHVALQDRAAYASRSLH